MITRRASATWEGGLKNGKGSFKGQTGLAAQYSFNSRFENGTGSNPEELLAAAHAACFSMALALGLEQAGKPATKIETQAACNLEQKGSGFRVTTMKLTTRAQVPGLDGPTFQKIAEATKEGCPISNVMKGNVQLELDAQLL